MVDEIANSAPAPAASTAPSAGEAAASPSNVAITPESPLETPIAPAEPTPPAEPAPVPEPTPAAEPVEMPKADTLLGGEKKIEEKPDETKEQPAPEEKPAEETPAEEPTPAYEPFALPENVAFDAEKMGEFTKTLGEFEKTTKASHEEVQKLGQSLIDRHVAEVESTLQRYTKSLTEAWNKQKNDWKNNFLKDPEFLNRTDTAVNSAIDAIGVYGGDSKQQEEFRNLMETTGVGNHPAMIRLLSNVMVAKAEPRPLAAPQIAKPATQSKIQKMYGKKSG